jgi:flagellar motor switch protein FliN/FliY
MSEVTDVTEVTEAPVVGAEPAVAAAEPVVPAPVVAPEPAVAPLDVDGEDAEIHFETFDAPIPTVTSDGTDLGRVIDVPVELAVEIGRTTMTIGETLSLAPGSIVSLNRLAGEPVDLLVNGKVIAQGEVVVIDEEFGLRITDIVSAHQRLSDASSPEE